ncbi:MAG: insulinase family protein, partial [Nitrospiria bacterium]
MSDRRRHLFFGIFLIFSFLQQEAIGFELKPIRVVTENGITLLIVEQPSLPIVSVEALVRAGAIHDPNQRAGLANITATLLDEGTTGRTAVEISDAVDAIGARLSTRARYDYMTAGL